MKNLIRIAKIAAAVAVGVVVLLLLAQHGMIYFPRAHGKSLSVQLPARAEMIEYTTGEGAQCAFYLPAAEAAPKRIWVLFGGNASLALDWCDFVKRDKNTGDAFLLIDFPGYGKCKGSASPASIAESVEVATAELAKKLGVDAGTQHWNVLAHSIGCGPGLEFATRHRVDRMVLVAPFTSLRAMARRTVGFPLCYVLLHNFDNRARLAELSASSQPPAVTLFHGSADEVIPVTMGRALAGEFPSMIKYHEVAGGDHNSIVSEAEQALLAAMNE